MLSKKQLKEYRELRGLSYRDVANYCDISHVMIHHIECGERDLTEHAYKEIIKGINDAYQAKKRGTLIKGTKSNASEEKQTSSAAGEVKEKDVAINNDNKKVAKKVTTTRKQKVK